jgi:outer membrane protein assembly factor BamE
MPKLTARLSTLALATLLVGCTPHLVEIRQGNYLTQEVIEQLEVGMTRDQVRYLLGTPVVASPFHPTRWDYVYARKRHREAEEYAYLVVWFDEYDTVERVDVRAEPPSA